MSAFASSTEESAERHRDDAPGRGLQRPAGMSIPADEWRFIFEAATDPAWMACLETRLVPADVLRRLTASHGVDYATAAAYAWLLCSALHGPFIKAFCAGAAAGPCPEAIREATRRLTVLVVPGAFYEEYPQTGAGGESLIGELQSLGIRVERIPTLSTGTLEQNTAIVRQALREHAESERIVVSLSRGGAEIKCALRDDPESLRGVSLWLSVGGVLVGSPLIDWVRDRPFLNWLNWLIFCCRSRNYRCFTELARRAGGNLDFDFRVPDHLEVIHVIGFPLGRHTTTRYARNWHARFAAHGPNDGILLHEDVLKYPGRILPLWGADHYASDRWDFRFLAAGILRHWHSLDRDRRSASSVAGEP